MQLIKTFLKSSHSLVTICFVLSSVLAGVFLVGNSKVPGDGNQLNNRHEDRDHLRRLGKRIFRYDTFGNEQKWTDELRMHEVIEKSVDPLTALSVGLKVDVDAIPDEVLDAIAAGEVDLTDPQTTLALIQLDAVIGVSGQVDFDGERLSLTSMGITCALCHSNVDDSFIPGIGKRLDGWANLDLNPGAIIALSPAVSEEDRAVYQSWGPGKYDPRFNIDGLSTPLVLPPIYGLEGVKRATFTADGDIKYWNRYVAVTQMGGHGTFVDRRLEINIHQRPDRVKRKLKPLEAYQLSLRAPQPPENSFDEAAAIRGEIVFQTTANCAKCHTGDLLTDVNRRRLHSAEEMGLDGAYAMRTITKKYRTTPLRALWQHAPYFHDGSAGTLEDVVEHYDTHFQLHLALDEKLDLVEYLKSL